MKLSLHSVALLQSSKILKLNMATYCTKARRSIIMSFSAHVLHARNRDNFALFGPLLKHTKIGNKNKATVARKKYAALFSTNVCRDEGNDILNLDFNTNSSIKTDEDISDYINRDFTIFEKLVLNDVKHFDIYEYTVFGSIDEEDLAYLELTAANSIRYYELPRDSNCQSLEQRSLSPGLLSYRNITTPLNTNFKRFLHHDIKHWRNYPLFPEDPSFASKVICDAQSPSSVTKILDKTKPLSSRYKQMTLVNKSLNVLSNIFIIYYLLLLLIKHNDNLS